VIKGVCKMRVAIVVGLEMRKKRHFGALNIHGLYWKEWINYPMLCKLLNSIWGGVSDASVEFGSGKLSFHSEKTLKP
jgi:hypothetical protein